MVGRDRRRAAQRGQAPSPAWAEIAAGQAGVVGRGQLLASGLTCGQVGALLDGRRWTGVLPGVYATFTGAVPPTARAWAAVLYAGPGAALGGTAALWLGQVIDAPPQVMTVCVPASRRVCHQEGVRIVHRRQLAGLVHPAALPPRLRVEAALLDVTADARDDARAVDLVLAATRGRVTTPERLRTALAARARHPRRALLADLLAEAAVGVQSGLERRWLHDVERRHGLPRGERNTPETGDDGRRRYRDVRYRRWGVVVELDGQEAHPDWSRFRDRERDNAVVAAGEVALRYGWRDTVDDPCAVAAQVAQVLRRQGWPGTPRPCGPSCLVRTA